MLLLLKKCVLVWVQFLAILSSGSEYALGEFDQGIVNSMVKNDDFLNKKLMCPSYLKSLCKW